VNGKNLEKLQSAMRRRNGDVKQVERISQVAPIGRPRKVVDVNDVAKLRPEPEAPPKTAKNRAMYLHNDAMEYLEKLAEADDTTASHTLARILKGLQKLGVWSAIDFVRNGVDQKAVRLLRKGDSSQFVM
jgi:hypothetical protein